MPDAAFVEHAHGIETPAMMHLRVSHGGRTDSVAVDEHMTVAHLKDTLYTLFNVDCAHQKVLLPRGARMPLDDGSARVSDVVRDAVKSKTSSTSTETALGTIKAMLLGPTLSSVDKMHRYERERMLKKQAFDHHSRHKPVVLSSTRFKTIGQDEDDVDKFKFHEIKPFGKDVECFRERERMLNRLADDEAVRDVMRRHRFVVGTLTELHPLLQPTLLGLNRNAGQEISLRLLTDDLSGTRSYLDVRRVLLHELSHNKFGPHDDDFKTLNSLLNRQVAEYETQHGIKTLSGPHVEPWEPQGAESGLRPKGGRTLQSGDDDDVDEGEERRKALEWTEEEWVEMRREKMRIAAEKRLQDQQR
ncbi:hypothetical protein OIV83_002969 [Microbotryomycetes sp. JL201]|nr:hypothetical protein OIV83_002969 [Microbotryomycetes sp. JL201]